MFKEIKFGHCACPPVVRREGTARSNPPTRRHCEGTARSNPPRVMTLAILLIAFTLIGLTGCKKDKLADEGTGWEKVGGGNGECTNPLTCSTTTTPGGVTGEVGDGGECTSTNNCTIGLACIESKCTAAENKNCTAETAATKCGAGYTCTDDKCVAVVSDDTCDADSDCPITDQICSAGKCTAPAAGGKKAANEPCTDDDQCESNDCSSGVCAGSSTYDDCTPACDSDHVCEDGRCEIKPDTRPYYITDPDDQNVIVGSSVTIETIAPQFRVINEESALDYSGDIDWVATPADDCLRIADFSESGATWTIRGLSEGLCKISISAKDVHTGADIDAEASTVDINVIATQAVAVQNIIDVRGNIVDSGLSPITLKLVDNSSRYTGPYVWRLHGKSASTRTSTSTSSTSGSGTTAPSGLVSALRVMGILNNNMMSTAVQNVVGIFGDALMGTNLLPHGFTILCESDLQDSCTLTANIAELGVGIFEYKVQACPAGALAVVGPYCGETKFKITISDETSVKYYRGIPSDACITSGTGCNEIDAEAGALLNYGEKVTVAVSGHASGSDAYECDIVSSNFMKILPSRRRIDGTHYIACRIVPKDSEVPLLIELEDVSVTVKDKEDHDIGNTNKTIKLGMYANPCASDFTVKYATSYDFQTDNTDVDMADGKMTSEPVVSDIVKTGRGYGVILHGDDPDVDDDVSTVIATEATVFPNYVNTTTEEDDNGAIVFFPRDFFGSPQLFATTTLPTVKRGDNFAVQYHIEGNGPFTVKWKNRTGTRAGSPSEVPADSRTVKIEESSQGHTYFTMLVSAGESKRIGDHPREYEIEIDDACESRPAKVHHVTMDVNCRVGNLNDGEGAMRLHRVYYSPVYDADSDFDHDVDNQTKELFGLSTKTTARSGRFSGGFSMPGNVKFKTSKTHVDNGGGDGQSNNHIIDNVAGQLSLSLRSDLSEEDENSLCVEDMKSFMWMTNGSDEGDGPDVWLGATAAIWCPSTEALDALPPAHEIPEGGGAATPEAFSGCYYAKWDDADDPSNNGRAGGYDIQPADYWRRVFSVCDTAKDYSWCPMKSDEKSLTEYEYMELIVAYPSNFNRIHDTDK